MAAHRRSIPDKWDEFEAVIPEDERGDMVEAYRKRLTSDDKDEQLRCRQGVEQVGGRYRHPAPEPETVEHFTSPEVAVAVARIENHYMATNGWFEEGQLLKGAEKLRGIPGVIVQGRHDTCTPPAAAWALKKAWPEVELQIIPDGGPFVQRAGYPRRACQGDGSVCGQLGVIARTAKQSSGVELDCFVAPLLAMTGRGEE